MPTRIVVDDVTGPKYNVYCVIALHTHAQCAAYVTLHTHVYQYTQSSSDFC